MIRKQQSLQLSAYADLYDLIVPKDHTLRKLNDLIDFSFIYDELVQNYNVDHGRSAIDPIRMFKYLLLKSMFPLSDVDLVERSRYDMSYKYFLGMAPEEEVIDSSSLTKFRKLRLKDLNVLDLLIGKTVELAVEQGVIKSKTIIVDSTHTQARYNQKKPIDILRERSKNLRKAVYSVDESIKSNFPAKPTQNDLDEELVYTQTLLSVIKQHPTLHAYPKVTEPLNLVEETVNDDIERLQSMKDQDARRGHKSADTSFFGYKTHLAMSDERVITAAVITTGEKSDAKQLRTLIEKSVDAGMTVESVIGDAAYSGKDHLLYAKANQIELISKTNPSIAHGTRSKEEEFEFNKDAGMYVCKAGHLAILTHRQGTTKQGKNQRQKYYFDIEKCKTCPFQEGCYKQGAKSKTYSVTIHSPEHEEHLAFEQSETFKEKAKTRYKIEAKNSELKHRHGYKTANSSGLLAMEIQGAMAIFSANLKRILKVMEQK